MQTKKEIPISAMKSGEATEIQLLYGVWNILDGENQKRLEPRLRACGQWANYRMMNALSGRVVNGLMLTVPPDKAQRFLMQLGNQELRVVPTTSTAPKPGYMYVEEDHLRDLLVVGMQNMCILCDGGHQQRKGCKLRRIIRDVCMFELHESKTECLGQWLLARYQREEEA